jgi:hypothetical protein
MESESLLPYSQLSAFGPKSDIYYCIYKSAGKWLKYEQKMKDYIIPRTMKFK